MFMLSMNRTTFSFERFSLTPALSRLERENNRPMACAVTMTVVHGPNACEKIERERGCVEDQPQRVATFRAEHRTSNDEAAANAEHAKACTPNAFLIFEFFIPWSKLRDNL